MEELPVGLNKTQVLNRYVYTEPDKLSNTKTIEEQELFLTGLVYHLNKLDGIVLPLPPLSLLFQYQHLLYNQSTDHECSRKTCVFLKFSRHQIFLSRCLNQRFVATGNIFICLASGQSHECGLGVCKYTEQELIFCPISDFAVGMIFEEGLETKLVNGERRIVGPYKNRRTTSTECNDEMEDGCEEEDDDMIEEDVWLEGITPHYVIQEEITDQALPPLPTPVETIQLMKEIDTPRKKKPEVSKAMNNFMETFLETPEEKMDKIWKDKVKGEVIKLTPLQERLQYAKKKLEDDIEGLPKKQRKKCITAIDYQKSTPYIKTLKDAIVSDVTRRFRNRGDSFSPEEIRIVRRRQMMKYITFCNNTNVCPQDSYLRQLYDDTEIQYAPAQRDLSNIDKTILLYTEYILYYWKLLQRHLFPPDTELVDKQWLEEWRKYHHSILILLRDGLEIDDESIIPDHPYLKTQVDLSRDNSQKSSFDPNKEISACIHQLRWTNPDRFELFRFEHAEVVANKVAATGAYMT
jgi:hypothetical protein